MRPDPAPGFEHGAAGRVGCVRVQQVHQRVGLVVQALVLAWMVAMDVGAGRRVWLVQALDQEDAVLAADVVADTAELLEA